MNKFHMLLKVIAHNGGWIKSSIALCRYDSLKFGKLKGTDSFGNRYYENPYYFLGRSRWVLYSDRFGYDYQACQVESKWFRWLHYMTDHTPLEENLPTYHWSLKHTENLSGTKEEYVPYSTTKPKIQAWKPPKVNSNRK